MGIALTRLGRHDESLVAYDWVIALKPGDGGTLLARARVLTRLNRHEEVIAACDQALALSPNDPAVHVQRGNALWRLNRNEEALLSYDSALALKPDHAIALNNQANTLVRLGRHEEALRSTERALALQADYPEALNNRALALQAFGRYEEALAACERALALKPDYLEALNNRGRALAALGRHQDAIASFDQILARNPNDPNIYVVRARAFTSLGKPEEALASYDQALALNPNNPDLLNKRVFALVTLRRHEEALAWSEKALALKPDDPNILNNRAVALIGLGRHAEALPYCDQALALDPRHADAHYNRGVCLNALGRHQEAGLAYDQALALRSDFNLALWNKSLSLLVTGDLEAGFRAYESRWDAAEPKPPKRDFTQPLWLGAEHLADKTILLHAEQGLGDTLQFCRYVPLVAARGARVVLEVQRSLKALLKNFDGASDVLAKGEPLPAFDLHCPLLSLPLAFGTRLDTIPAKIPYLQAPPDRLAAWQQKLSNTEGFRIGLVWFGNPKHRNDHNRSIALSLLEPLLTNHPRVSFHSLQKDPRPEDKALLSELPQLHDHSAALKDFAETAGLVACLDLVISVDTAPVHLAGAMGKPVWLLLPFAPDWRWLEEREDSPWYPGIRLFRQPTPGDWGTVVARLVTALDAFTQGPVPERPKIVSVVQSSEPTAVSVTTESDTEVLERALQHYRAGRHEDTAAFCESLLERAPDTLIALQVLGAIRLDEGRLEEALALAERACAVAPDNPDSHGNLGIVLDRLGRKEEALAAYDRVIVLKPGDTGALLARARMLSQLNRHEEVIAACDRVLILKSDDPAVHVQRGNALWRLNRNEEALLAYERALILKPDHAIALNNHANTLTRLGRHEAALASVDRALALQADYPEALNNRAVALHALGRYDEALAACDRALALKPDYIEALNNRGRALAALGRHHDAIACYDQILARNPNDLNLHMLRGIEHSRLNRYEEAIACYDRALALDPTNADAHYNRGIALGALDRRKEALISYDQALALRPNYPEALINRASAKQILKRHEEAAEDLAQALRLQPDAEYIPGMLNYLRLHCCDWRTYEKDATALIEAVRAGKGSTVPFVFLPVSSSASDQLRCAQIWVKDKCPPAATALWSGVNYRHERIRLAYLSADFHAHATAYLMAELFERHDKQRFETFAFSFGPDAPSAMRQRLLRSFDHFIEVKRKSDREVALLMREHEIDIAVDLKGFTLGSRPGILAFRPAPVQINYLGYPGTMGAPYIDYILADKVVIREDQRDCYAEQVVYLPDCYQVNDRKREIATTTPSRAALGLPEQGFVFCSFNNPYENTPPVFAIWMRLLAQIPGSVLWLLEGSATVPRNLRAAASAHGIAPERLIFAPKAPLAEHLARQRRADLFLDTLPVNAHTTASDALWAGLPLLTCLSTTFAGRVAASLLQAAGLPELISHSLADYEALALKLAQEPAMLGTLRTKLARQRDACPLFDTERFRRHIEAAYFTMHERAQRGEPPKGFAVPPIS
jgi:predicted O-linked N-acetylglucosamine transferase (SPINDLY family)